MTPTKTRFTLIELLVVIGIIAVLASLLLPALQGAKQKGQQAVCQGNQKQLVVAALLYADDENVLPPIARGLNLTRWYQKDFLGQYLSSDWPKITKIDGYEVPVKGTVLDCLTQRVWGDAPHASWIGYNSSMCSGVAENYTRGPFLREFVDPLRVPIVADSRNWGTVYVSNYTNGGAAWMDTSGVVDFRHSGGTNYGFTDGHVAFIPDSRKPGNGDSPTGAHEFWFGGTQPSVTLPNVP